MELIGLEEPVEGESQEAMALPVRSPDRGPILIGDGGRFEPSNRGAEPCAWKRLDVERGHEPDSSLASIRPRSRQ